MTPQCEEDRTHDLVALGLARVDRGIAIPVTLDTLRAINPFAVEFRYDDTFDSSVTREELNVILSAMLE